jgi:uncharacterized membrane protein YtjA (UPF0391 family)
MVRRLRSLQDFSRYVVTAEALLPGHTSGPKLTRRSNMLRWALIFFVVALLAAVLGFTGIAAAAAGVAKALFFLFVILFLVTLLGHVARRP